MTRINLIHPRSLTDQHLIAEYREIVRLKRPIDAGWTGELPNGYVLGAGHVRFFYDKEGWLWDRFESLKHAMEMRAYAVNLPNVFSKYECSWEPSRDEIMLNVERIVERVMSQKSIPRMNGQHIDREWYCDWLRSGV